MPILDIVSRVVGGITYAAHEIAGLSYRAAPIEHRQQIIVPALPFRTAVEVDFSDQLSFPILITGIVLDVMEDDDNPLGLVDAEDNANHWIDLRVQSINRVTRQPESKIYFRVESFPQLKNELIIDPRTIYRFKSSRSLNSLIITGKPLYLRNRLTFGNKIVIE